MAERMAEASSSSTQVPESSSSCITLGKELRPFFAGPSQHADRTPPLPLFPSSKTGGGRCGGARLNLQGDARGSEFKRCTPMYQLTHNMIAD